MYAMCMQSAQAEEAAGIPGAEVTAGCVSGGHGYG